MILRYFLFQATLIPSILVCTNRTASDAGIWLQNMDDARNLLQGYGSRNRTANRCLSIVEGLCNALRDDGNQTADLGTGLDFLRDLCEQFIPDHGEQSLLLPGLLP